MNRIILILIILTGYISQAQILEPVKWVTSVEKLTENEYVLLATATIDSNWHLYSQSVPENGPIATVFVFEGNKNYIKKGNTVEDDGEAIYDQVFQMPIKYFSKKAVFKQRIKSLTSESFPVNATVEFMACDDESCLPPTTVDLVFQIN